MVRTIPLYNRSLFSEQEDVFNIFHAIYLSRKFDPSKRARELFNALDDDGNGFLTEDEFVSGCMSDTAFVKVLDDFSADFIFGYTQK